MASAAGTSPLPSNLQLHLCVWDNNINALEALLCTSPNLEEVDPKGYTPLCEYRALVHTLRPRSPSRARFLPCAYPSSVLALAMGRTEAARLLLAAGAFPKARLRDSASGIDTWETVQVAGLTANPEITRHAVVAYLAETDRAFERRLPAVQRALEGVPDFEVRTVARRVLEGTVIGTPLFPPPRPAPVSLLRSCA